MKKILTFFLLSPSQSFSITISLSSDLEERRHDFVGEPGAGAGDDPRVPDRSRGKLPRSQQPHGRRRVVVGGGGVVSHFLLFRFAYSAKNLSGGGAECCTGNDGITSQMGHTGLFGPLFHFLWDILHPHPVGTCGHYFACFSSFVCRLYILGCASRFLVAVAFLRFRYVARFSCLLD